MIAWLRLPRLREIEAKPARAYCETDGWSFNPRYTQGRCPICGWQPEGVATAPAWLAIANRLDWQMLGLFLFADVLVLLGLLVASATGLIPHDFALGLPPSHGPGGVLATSARTH